MSYSSHVVSIFVVNSGGGDCFEIKVWEWADSLQQSLWMDWMRIAGFGKSGYFGQSLKGDENEMFAKGDTHIASLSLVGAADVRWEKKSVLEEFRLKDFQPSIDHCKTTYRRFVVEHPEGSEWTSQFPPSHHKILSCPLDFNLDSVVRIPLSVFVLVFSLSSFIVNACVMCRLLYTVRVRLNWLSASFSHVNKNIHSLIH